MTATNKGLTTNCAKTNHANMKHPAAALPAICIHVSQRSRLANISCIPDISEYISKHYFV
jgi:hypothetical protein